MHFHTEVGIPLTDQFLNN